MRTQVRRTTVYAATTLALVAILAGFALAYGGIGPVGASQQDLYRYTIAQIPGLTFTGSSLVNGAPGTPPDSSCDPGSSGCDISGTAVVVCASASCPTGHYYQTVSFTNPAGATNEICGATDVNATITASIESSVPSPPLTAYVYDSGTAGGTVTLYVDQGPSSAPSLPDVTSVIVTGSCL